MGMRSATGENWNGLQGAMSVQLEGCVHDPPYNPNMCGFSSDLETCIPLNGCGSPAAFGYYMSFTLFVSFVFLNLFIAVILEASEISTETEKESLSEEHLHQFMIQWVKYDVNDQRSISLKHLRTLLQELERPMGFGISYVASESEITELIKDLQIPVYIDADRVPIVLFMDTVHALAARVHERQAQRVGKSLKDMAAVPAGSPFAKARNKALSRNLMLAGLDDSSSVTYTTNEVEGARTIQRNFKSHKLRKEIGNRVNATKE